MKHFEFGDDPLDLSYITDRVIVIANPYENDRLASLQRFLAAKHANHYRIFNLTVEREYNLDQDLQNVTTFPIVCGTPPPLQLLVDICSSIEGYLNTHEENVAILHSPHGRGRSSQVASCYMLHSGQVEFASKAVDFVTNQRGPLALTIPSQIRYVYYYEKMLRTDRVLLSTYRILLVRLHTVPEFNASLVNSGCTPNLEVHTSARISETSLLPGDSLGWAVKPLYRGAAEGAFLSRVHKKIDFDLRSVNVFVRGDVFVSVLSEGEKMCQAAFHTAFIDNSFLHFERSAIDLVHSDEYFHIFRPEFAMDIVLERVTDQPELNTVSPSELEVLIRDGSQEAPATALYCEK